ncbi:MAG: glycosyltransferase [Bacteroidota bacterium]
MPDNNNFDAAYIAFDPYPSFKGSATHITEVWQTIKNVFGNCLLMTLSGTSPILTDQWQPESPEGNYLTRGMGFSKQVNEKIATIDSLQFVQYRDIWGGLAVSQNKNIYQVFEANGFPSIELKERYAILPKSTVQKIEALESICLYRANEVVCPSKVIAEHIMKRGVPGKKIHVIPNGTHIPTKLENVEGLPEQYVVYFGALQPWQGVSIAIKAMKYLDDLSNLKLVICSSHKEKLSKQLKKLISNADLEDQIVWFHQLPKNQLHYIIQNALISLAPLSECERNLEQGCSPLKIYESMACKTAIIASDIPVAREILTHNENAILIKPDRPAELARNIRMLIEQSDTRKKIAAAAYKKVLLVCSWEVSNQKLGAIYQKQLTAEVY